MENLNKLKNPFRINKSLKSLILIYVALIIYPLIYLIYRQTKFGIFILITVLANIGQMVSSL